MLRQKLFSGPGLDADHNSRNNNNNSCSRGGTSHRVDNNNCSRINVDDFDDAGSGDTDNFDDVDAGNVDDFDDAYADNADDVKSATRQKKASSDADVNGAHRRRHVVVFIRHLKRHSRPDRDERDVRKRDDEHHSL